MISLANDLIRDHDLVIADGPAGMDDLSRTLLLLSQLALIPVGPSILDLRSVTEATRIVRYAQQINTNGLEGALILNRIGVRDRITRELLAIADGVLIDVSDMASEAGFRYPLAVTATVWANHPNCASKTPESPYSLKATP